MIETTTENFNAVHEVFDRVDLTNPEQARLGIFYQVGYLPQAILGREPLYIRRIFYRPTGEIFGFGFIPETGEKFNFCLQDLVEKPVEEVTA